MCTSEMRLSVFSLAQATQKKSTFFHFEGGSSWPEQRRIRYITHAEQMFPAFSGFESCIDGTRKKVDCDSPVLLHGKNSDVC